MKQFTKSNLLKFGAEMRREAQAKKIPLVYRKDMSDEKFDALAEFLDTKAAQLKQDFKLPQMNVTVDDIVDQLYFHPKNPDLTSIQFPPEYDDMEDITNMEYEPEFDENGWVINPRAIHVQVLRGIDINNLFNNDSQSQQNAQDCINELSIMEYNTIMEIISAVRSGGDYPLNAGSISSMSRMLSGAKLTSIIPSNFIMAELRLQHTGSNRASQRIYIGFYVKNLDNIVLYIIGSYTKNSGQEIANKYFRSMIAKFVNSEDVRDLQQEGLNMPVHIKNENYYDISENSNISTMDFRLTEMFTSIDSEEKIEARLKGIEDRLFEGKSCVNHVREDLVEDYNKGYEFGDEYMREIEKDNSDYKAEEEFLQKYLDYRKKRINNISNTMKEEVK